MIRFWLLFVCCTLLKLTLTQAQALDIAQYNALMDVYSSLGCNSTVCPRFNVLSECVGEGLDCVAGKVTGLDISVKKLSGSIPSTIGQLTDLSSLNLFNNELIGSIPSTIGQLKLLRSLYLYNNQLVGPIPETIGLLTALNILYFYNNQLAGTIPSTIGQLTSLAYLFLHTNQLTGQIPSTLGRLSSLLLCGLQLAANDENCLDCSTIHRGSICNCEQRMTMCSSVTIPMSSQSLTSSTTASIVATSTSASVSTTDPSTSTSGSTMPTPVPSQPTTDTKSSPSAISTSPTPAISTSSTLLETSSNATDGVATASLPVPAFTEGSAALIGGIVGGVVALLLVGGLIVFLARRCGRRGKVEPNNDAALQSVRQGMPNNSVHDGGGAASHRSNYDSLALSPPDVNYGAIAPQNYDAWSTKDDYSRPSPNRTDYEDFTKIQ